MTTAETAAACRRNTEAWGTLDPDAIAQVHAPDGVFHLHSGEEPVVGRDAIRSRFATLIEQFPDLGYEQVSLRIGEGFWVAEWRMTGTPAGGGPQISCELIDVIEVRDGLIASKHSYIDAVGLQAQLAAAAA